MIRNFATFDCLLPDDSTENQAGDIIVPAGRNIIELIASKTKGASESVQHSFYGWRFEFPSSPGRKASVLLQKPDKWLLIVEVQRRWFGIGLDRNASTHEAVKMIHDSLNDIPAISNVSWHTNREFVESQRR